MIGTDFMYALAYHWNKGTDIISVFPTNPSFTLLTGMVTKSMPILVVLYVGVLGNFWNYPYNNTMGATRPMLAMAFDRLLPEKVADVSDRFHIPHIAIAVNYVLVWIWYYIITFTPFSAWLTSMMASASLSIACTLLSAILLPYRRKDLFESSPASKYKLIGIPIITICGIIGFIWNLIMLYFYLVVPAYGGGNPIPLAVNLLILAGCFVYYFAIHSYRKKQGIETDLAFKQLPPE
jgi:amino acid transporter